jgi:UDP-N-acetylglucosamine diphosphorylase / glucose-1-phosphate thymidylyltransferase / UDP-N-acetylgalactosamine diphosphorylase / glucosamine-1-phosphate N-acetyltransferase / galactosamine-1-phosphate N-acetyltransferase
MKAIVLTAGPGTRLEPLTETRPKAMISICGKPVLSRTLESLSQIGIQDTAVVVNPRYPELDRMLNTLKTPDNPTFTLYTQEHSQGVGNGILAAADYIDKRDYFLLAYGDILFSDNMFQSLIRSFNSIKKPVASVSLTGNSSDFGIIYMDHEMKINRIIEKPKTPNLGNYILAGAFILPGTFFDILETCSGNVIDAFRILQNTSSLYASIWEGDWMDIAYPWSILSAGQMIMSQWESSILATTTTIETGTMITGPVVIEENVIIKAGASILGPCFIGKNSFIGHNALLRENTCIGEGSTIGFGVEVKNSVLMPGTEIGRLSFIGDSVIGEKVNVGSATILVNINMDHSSVKVDIAGESIDSGFHKLGSFIGDNTWIGANHTFLPGTKIPANQTIPHFGTYPQK